MCLSNKRCKTKSDIFSGQKPLVLEKTFTVQKNHVQMQGKFHHHFHFISSFKCVKMNFKICMLRSEFFEEDIQKKSHRSLGYVVTNFAQKFC